MKSFHLLPHRTLRPFIDRLWGWESASGEVVRLPTLLPGTGAELYFHYGEPFRYTTTQEALHRCDSGHLFCVRRTPIRLSPSAGVGFIAVRFKIGMIHRFTGIPGNELLDCRQSVEEIWGAPGSILIRHLSWTSTLGERLALIQSFLTDRLRSDPVDAAVETAMTRLYRQYSSLSIEALAESVYLGRRQLERRFKAISGQSPGETRRLGRFQHTIRRLMLDVSANPTDVALSNGYFDQAHFIHDFRRLTGRTPLRHLEEARTKTHFYNTSGNLAGILAAPEQPH